MFSIYFYLFNASKFPFLEETIPSFCNFAEEVVCATIPCEDNTIEVLDSFKQRFSNFTYFTSDIKTEGNNRFDGQLKTAALQRTTQPIKIIADADEVFYLSQKSKWIHWGECLLKSDYDGLFVPVIDFWGDKKYIRKNVRIGQKFRMHKNTVVSRGVIPQAELGNGLFDINMSDSTEGLLQNGTLARFCNTIPLEWLMPENIKNLDKRIYVGHLGYLDFNYRINVANSFWEPHWRARDGKDFQHTENKLENLKKEEIIKHYLSLV